MSPVMKNSRNGPLFQPAGTVMSCLVVYQIPTRWQDVEITMTQAVETKDTAARKAWMGLLARAAPARLRGLMPNALPSYSLLRQPEVGAVMVRGRTGGTGAPFNLGEMTVTRCSVVLTTGEVGHAHVQGRDRDHARLAALVDAMMQTDAAPKLRADVLDILKTDETAARQARAMKAAATKVEFFTMVRGEDQ
jgi:alpha-D-ribose 1-methylphosphonate 5-triphosphate synthase subunit PhnG